MGLIFSQNPRVSGGSLNFASSRATVSVPGIVEASAAQAAAGTESNFYISPRRLYAVTPTRLAADRDYYVDASTGSDLNDGLLSTTAFATIQKALAVCYYGILFNNFSVRINVAVGTYNEKLVLGNFSGYNALNGYATLTIQATNGTPSNTKITASNGSGVGIFASGNTPHKFKGFQIANCSVAGVEADSGGVVAFDGCDFGAMTGNHMMSLYDGSRIVIVTNNYTISGGAGVHAYADLGGQIFVQPGKTCTLSGTPAFSAMFAFANHGGIMNFTSTTFTGSATGTRFFVANGGGIHTNGGGANFFPGNVAGSTTSPGWYS